MFSEDSEVTKRDLECVLADAGVKHSLVKSNFDADHILFKGKLSFFQLPYGFQLHCSDVLERCSGSSSAELSECISMTILLKGSVEFMLADAQFHFSAEESPIIFINVINKPQIFTRYLRKNQSVKKINILIDKSWITKRSKSLADKQQLKDIFPKNFSVQQLPCSNNIVKLAKQLFDVHQLLGIENQLFTEQLSLQVFSHCFSLLKRNHNNEVTAERTLNEKANDSLGFEHQLTELIDEDLSLNKIATMFGASVSTLQRHFKENHQLTVSEFIRNKRLEKARRAIIFDGLTVGEAAYNAGYRHVSNFSVAFKKYFSMTPAQMKRKYQTLVNCE